jgi:hypothetical protein
MTPPEMLIKFRKFSGSIPNPNKRLLICFLNE